MLILSGSSHGLGQGLGLDPVIANTVTVQKAINAAAEARGISKRGPEGGFFDDTNYATLIAVCKSVLADKALQVALSTKTFTGLSQIASGKVTLDQFVEVSIDSKAGMTDTVNAMNTIISHSDPSLRDKKLSTGAKLALGGAVVLTVGLLFYLK